MVIDRWIQFCGFVAIDLQDCQTKNRDIVQLWAAEERRQRSIPPLDRTSNLIAKIHLWSRCKRKKDGYGWAGVCTPHRSRPATVGLLGVTPSHTWRVNEISNGDTEISETCKTQTNGLAATPNPRIAASNAGSTTQREQAPSSQSGTADSKIKSREARTSHYSRLDLEIGGRRAVLEKERCLLSGRNPQGRIIRTFSPFRMIQRRF